MANESILLESGTNEVEILEFVLGDQSFGVNVLKIQAIEQLDPTKVTAIHMAHPAVVGTLLFRDSCITLIDLTKMTTAESASSSSQPPLDPSNGTVLDQVTLDIQDAKPLVLILEFNNRLTAFTVSGVHRIHRVSWEAITPLNPYLSSAESQFTSSLHIEGREILIMDMEKIVAEILTHDQEDLAVSPEIEPSRAEIRSRQTIFLAEDSPTIRTKIIEELAKAHYTDIHPFSNGKDCYEELLRQKELASAEGKPLCDRVSTVISDIEMPTMDGLALCRAIKSTGGAPEVPVIMFSSLINEQLARKCEGVGADAFVTKPRFHELVTTLDRRLCL